MARCDRCGSDCVLPFTCQYCGGKYCPDCRLPPNHDCTGIAGWNAKPRPAVGVNYSRGGGISATGGIAPERRHREGKEAKEGLSYLAIMAVIIALIVIGLAWLVLIGYRI